MARQNRVDPFGRLVAVPERGAWLGNRGHLLDRQGRLARQWQLQRWLICVLAFKQRRRQVWTPGLYTELFFLDEATALAAGHRPCAECRRPAAMEFRRLWEGVHGPVASLPALDAQLHAARFRRFEARLADLPTGTFVAVEQQAYLVRRGELHLWTPGGYGAPVPEPPKVLQVLTPEPVVRVLQAGYAPQIAPEAAEPARFQ